jgi:N4-(beta-N-acetylglucosaminyl)-L-asparaginase
LFVDNEVGAATATGIGEEVMQTAGSFLVVENMRRGMSPQQACRDAVERILHKHPAAVHGQVAYLALRRDGQVGAYSIQQDFNYAHFDGEHNRLVASDYAVCAA